MPGKRSRDWCFTIWLHDAAGNLINDLDFQLSKDEFVPINSKLPKARYMVYQYEVGGEQKHLHIQGFIQFDHARDRTALAKKLDKWSGEKGTHLEMKLGTSFEAAQYCKKIDTQVAGPFEFGDAPTEDEDPPLVQAMKEYLKDGISEELVIKYPTYVTMYGEKWNRIKSQLDRKKLKKERNVYNKPKVIVLCGKTGKGKTSPAIEAGAVLYDYYNNVPFDHVDIEDKVLLLDEFTGQIPIAKLKTILDGYAFPVRQLYTGTVYRSFKEIYITSQVHPCKWYGGNWAEGDFEAFMRRVYHLKEFTDTDPDPIFIDNVRMNPYVIPDDKEELALETLKMLAQAQPTLEVLNSSFDDIFLVE